MAHGEDHLRPERPNLNLLGTREPENYGRATLGRCREAVPRHRQARFGLAIVFRQSNHEGELIDWIQEASAKQAAGIVINAGGYTHTSIAILDAIAAVACRSIEVHITNIHRARKHSVIIPMYRRSPRR